MSFFEFPYTRTYSSDLGWVIRQLKWVTEQVMFKTIKYADPLAWDITSQYEQNTIVMDQNTGIAYLSLQPVPAGITISNTDYWTPVFDLSQIINAITNNLTAHNNAQSPTLLGDVNEGDWILWNSKLYVALVNMTAGTALIEGSNVDAASVENLTKTYTDDVRNDLNAIIGDLANLLTIDKSSVVNAINEVLTTFINTVGNLANLSTTDKSSIVNAINEVLTTFITTVGDLANLSTTDKSSIVNAINEVLTTFTTTVGNLADLVTTDKSSIVNAINDEYNLRYNADITLNNRIGNLANLTTTDQSSAVAAINEVNAGMKANYMSLERQKSVLVLGDSFSVVAYVNPGEHWTELLHSRDKYNVYNYSVGGSGFVLHQTGSVYIEDEINTAYGAITYPDNIGYVILYGGLNDYNLGATGTQVYNAVMTAIASIRSKFPYAKICYVPFNYSYNATIKYNVMKFLAAMISAGHDSEVLTYEYAPFMFAHKMLGNLVFADGHPNAAGNEVEYNIMSQMLKGNNRPPKYQKYFTPATYGGVTMLQDIRGWIELEGYTYKSQVAFVVNPDAYAAGSLRIAQITEGDGSNGSFNVAWSRNMTYAGYGLDYSTYDLSFHNNVLDGSLAATFAHSQTFGGVSQGYYNLEGNIIDLAL